MSRSYLPQGAGHGNPTPNGAEMPKQNESAKGNPAAKRMNNPTLKSKRIRNRDRNERIQETTASAHCPACAAIVAPTRPPSSATANDQRSANGTRHRTPQRIPRPIRAHHPPSRKRRNHHKRGIDGEPTNTTHPLDYAAYAYGRHGGITERNYLLSQIRNELELYTGAAFKGLSPSGTRARRAAGQTRHSRHYERQSGNDVPPD